MSAFVSLLSVSGSSGADSRWLERPCVVAFLAERRFPAGVTGPVLNCALLWLASWRLLVKQRPRIVRRLFAASRTLLRVSPIPLDVDEVP